MYVDQYIDNMAQMRDSWLSAMTNFLFNEANERHIKTNKGYEAYNFIHLF